MRVIVIQNSVMLNLFQHPFRTLAEKAREEKWALKQVQGDGFGCGERAR